VSARPGPAELHAVALQVEQVATDLSRAVGAVASAGIVVDDEVTIAVATLTSWSSWLGERAERERQDDDSTPKEG